jgi:hypothetical protein
MQRDGRNYEPAMPGGFKPASTQRRGPRVPGFTAPWNATGPSRERRRDWLVHVFALVVAGVLAAVVATSAYGSSVSSASFSGGAGTFTSGTGVVYAKQGGVLTLAVTTSSDTKCVDVTGGGFAAQHQQSSTAKSSWTFSGLTAPAGDGPQSVSIVATPNFNAQNKCTGSSGSRSASYVLDNSAPALLPSDTDKTGVSPAPNAAGWNNRSALPGGVSITWSASDAGSGVASGPTPATDSVTANTNGTVKSASAMDRLGFTGNGSVTIKLDKVDPKISASPDPTQWYNHDVSVSFSCADPPPPEGVGKESGIKSCGPTPQTVSNGGSATGTAVDNADNSKSLTVGPYKIDKTAPSLSGSPTTSPNAAGWYSSNVVIHWTCADNAGGSGIAGSCPGDDTISSEASNQTRTASVSDQAGNTATATSSPAVNIDKTAPITNVTAPSGWNNQAVTLNFSATDALSGVDLTFSSVDGGLPQAGTSVVVSGDGQHTVEYWSVDKAGNIEMNGLSHKSVIVKIDGTPPTISASQSPAANLNGWNNGDVGVSFACADALSGIASCGPTPQLISSEGASQDVVGTAVDNASNSATAHAYVSLDKTPPSISAAADRAPNGAGWYDADVVVSFTCGDGLSGVDSCPAAQTLAEGANQSASGTATDAAGNAASSSVNGINVDKTAPSLSGAPTTAANGNGWYTGDVSIAWTCSDALSGIPLGACPGNSLITGEGSHLSASESVSDTAGNSSSKTVSGINIDRFAPSTSAGVPAPLDSGWYAGPVQVTLNGVDSLSGVDKTYYLVDAL